MGGAESSRAEAARKRIVFLSSLHPALDKRVFDKEAVSLAAAGFEVFHVCADPEFQGRANVRGVEIIGIERRGKSRLSQFAALARSARIAASLRPDAIHCNEVDSWVVGSLVATLTGAKCVFDAHEDYDAMVVERTPKALRAPALAIYRLITGVTKAMTWRVVLAKDSIRGEYRLPRNKVVTVANYGSLRLADRVRPEYPGGTVRLVHLGVLARSRGWPQMLRSLELCRDLNLHLTILGSFTDGSEQDFRQSVAEKGLSDRVKVIEWLPYEDAFELLLRTDIGLILFQPGHRNHVRAMPHKLFDYMLAGNAVIAPDFAPEVMQIMQISGAGLTVDPSRAEEIAAAIRTLATDAELRMAHARSGRNAVIERFNWQAEAKKLVEMYAEL